MTKELAAAYYCSSNWNRSKPVFLNELSVGHDSYLVKVSILKGCYFMFVKIEKVISVKRSYSVRSSATTHMRGVVLIFHDLAANRILSSNLTQQAGTFSFFYHIIYIHTYF